MSEEQGTTQVNSGTQELVINDDIKAKLRGFVAFDVKAAFEYIPKVYRDEKNENPRELWPVFTLKSKNGVEIAQAEDEAGYVGLGKKQEDESRLYMQTGKARLVTLEKGLVAVRNLLNENDEVVSWEASTGVMKIRRKDGTESIKNLRVRQFIEHIASKLQIDLQEAINERSTMTAEELSGLK